MYPNTITSLTNYTVSINLCIRIEKETMDKDEVYKTFASCIERDAKIKLRYNERLDADYIDIEWYID